MSFSVRLVPAVLLVILSFAASLCAQSTTRQTNKTPRGSVSGRVTIKEKGVPGVVVAMLRSERMTPFESHQRATTDQDGFYRISNVAPGSYEIVPSAPAFVMANARETRSKNVLVGEDENVESINFSLVRGGVITGRVTDAEGRPVIQQAVSVYRSDAFDRQSPQTPAFSARSVQTDDRGIYRVFGLTPGRYKVAAGRSDEGFTASFGPTRASYGQVFHPDVTDHAKASVIEVSEGSEATSVDIALGRVLQTFSASGRVIDGDKGLPMANVRFGIQRLVGPRVELVGGTPQTSNSHGDFVIEGLIPGKYTIYMSSNQSGGLRAEAPSFDVVDQDVSGLTIRLTKGASVSGVVMLETQDKGALQKFLQQPLDLRGFIRTQPATPGAGSSSSSPISPDGSFYLSGLSGGTLNFTLGARGNPFPPKGFSVARVERDGVVSTRGIEIKEGEQLAGVRVIISYGSANIRGLVKFENGSLPEGGRVFVRFTRPGETFNPMLRPPQVDARGHFLIEGLTAGTYELTVSVSGAQPAIPRVHMREVTVQDGMTTDVTFTIDMNAPPTRNQ